MTLTASVRPPQRGNTATAPQQAESQLASDPQARERHSAAGQTDARRSLTAIDLCLNELEERHLRGSFIAGRRACQQRVRALAAQTGAKPPTTVLQAATSYSLHAALLDWQSSVLDDLIRNRHQRYPDLDLERSEWRVSREARADAGERPRWFRANNRSVRTRTLSLASRLKTPV